MKNTLMLVVLAAVLSVCGCQQNSIPSPIRTSNIRYFKDYRTGLCFAAINSSTYQGYEVTSVTNVPCDNVGNFAKEEEEIR